MPDNVLSALFIRCAGSSSVVIGWLTDHSSAIQALNALAMIALTLAIVGVTWWQSNTTKKALLVANRQFELEWHPELHAKFMAVSNYDAAEITNLGRSTGLLLGLTLRPRSSEKSINFDCPDKKIIRAGESVVEPITRPLREYFERTNRINDDANETTKEQFEVSFSFYSAGKTSHSQWFAFLVERKGQMVRVTY